MLGEKVKMAYPECSGAGWQAVMRGYMLALVMYNYRPPNDAG